MATALAFGVVVSLGKMCRELRRWRQDQGRDKKPWDRAS